MHRPALEYDTNYSPPIALFIANADRAERNLLLMTCVTTVVQNIDPFEKELL